MRLLGDFVMSLNDDVKTAHAQVVSIGLEENVCPDT